ncbi:MAG: hypothetical protein GC179_22595 [Anaerolineaceae bacterium]|nr:hypothetical protein [Anaerolineaceae bacterium]
MNISEHVTISIELTPDEHEKLADLARKQGYDALTDYLRHIMTQDLVIDEAGDDPEIAFEEGWSDIVAGRVYPASALWDDTCFT